jgi:hypothetical protein
LILHGQFSFSIRFPFKERPEIAKCRQLKRFQICIASFPSFGRGFETHRPLQILTNLLGIPMKSITVSEVISITRSQVMPIKIGAKRR